jgi:hypothetical protein
MNADATIRRLVDDLRPVRRPPSAPARIMRWCVVVLAMMVFEIGVALARGTELQSVTGAASLSRAILPLVLALVAGAAALQLSIPGRAHRPWLAAAWLLIALWGGVLASAVASGAPAPLAAWMAGPGAKCAAHVAASAVPAGLALLWFVRAGAPLDGARTGILLALAASASGAAATQLTCPNHAAEHVLLWHAGAVVVIAMSGSATGRWLTAWRRPAAPHD